MEKVFKSPVKVNFMHDLMGTSAATISVGLQLFYFFSFRHYQTDLLCIIILRELVIYLKKNLTKLIYDASANQFEQQDFALMAKHATKKLHWHSAKRIKSQSPPNLTNAENKPASLGWTCRQFSQSCRGRGPNLSRQRFSQITVRMILLLIDMQRRYF